MNCPNRLGEDGDGPLCGDEGRLCDECGEAEMREWEWLKHVAPQTIMNERACRELMGDEAYEQELRDTGHLVPP